MTALVDLREAAQRLRSLAEAATKGPWRYDPDKMWLPEPDKTRRTLMALLGARGEEFVAAGPIGDSICVAGTGPADEKQSMADAAFMAAMHPGVALALADWLLARAAYVAGRSAATSAVYPELEDISEAAAEHSERHALAVARLLLGRQQP